MGSCPSRGTWIEISLASKPRPFSTVVPLTGHVDRNIKSFAVNSVAPQVVPLTGHVDRNITREGIALAETVVPLTGHVDRNGATTALRTA